MSGEGAANGAGDPTGGAGGAGDPAAGQGAGAGDPTGDVQRLTAALEAERRGHAETRQALAQAKNQGQQGGTAVTQTPNNQQGQAASGSAPAEDRIGALIAQVQALTERAEAAEHAALRGDVAKRFGLTDAQASRLVGKTKAELEADAEALAKDFGIKVPGAGDGDGGDGGDGGAGNGAAGAGAGQQGGAGTGAARRTTSQLRPGGANEGDAGRVTSRSEADKIAEEVLSSGF